MCRLFGAVEDLPCPHGCRPIGLMSRQQAHKILTSVYEGGVNIFVDTNEEEG